jgi:transposase
MDKVDERTPRMTAHAASIISDGTDPSPALAALIRVAVGVDVSKETLDACVLRPNGKSAAAQFRNEPSGFAKLLRWARSKAPGCLLHFCMEATGAYSMGLASYLVEEQDTAATAATAATAEVHLLVSVVNPFRVKHAALASGADNKTDASDARVIASYCLKETPAPWRLAAPEVRMLLALLRRHQALAEQLRQEENRLGEPGQFPVVLRSLRTSIRFLKKQMEELSKEIHDHIDRHPRLKRDRDLLVSVPGIGESLAATLLAELADVGQFASAKAVAAYAGLNPLENRSGKMTKRTHISKRGNGRLRRALYMPTLSALRCNPPVKDLYQRLTEAGMCKKAAVIAAMRKLLMIAYGVLKSQTAFCQKPAKAAA